MLSEEQLLDAFDRQDAAKQPIGKIALTSHLLSVGQVMKVLEAQVDDPRRFGELAVDLGMLDQDQVDELLTVQCDGRPCLVVTIAEITGLDVDELRERRAAYMAANV